MAGDIALIWVKGKRYFCNSENNFGIALAAASVLVHHGREIETSTPGITEKHMPLVENATIRKLRSGGLALGFGVHHLRTAAVGMIAAAAGHDWLFIDLEHGAFSQDDVAQICNAALPTGITPIVRICAGALDEGTRALDNGAAGVIVPHVDTVDQARRIATAFRYPPSGSRSWGGPSALYGYKAPGAPRPRPRSIRKFLWSR